VEDSKWALSIPSEYENEPKPSPQAPTAFPGSENPAQESSDYKEVGQLGIEILQEISCKEPTYCDLQGTSLAWNGLKQLNLQMDNLIRVQIAGFKGMLGGRL
jgi:hypothetical protein